jgi:maltooligosyltrehalose trehalohydrolase
MEIDSFGAVPMTGGVRFRIWAPGVRELILLLLDGAAAGAYRPGRDEDGVFDIIVDKAGAGDRYSYRLDGGASRPDPASRFQPDGVHGPSQIVDAASFAWTDRRWMGRAPRDLIVYELHVGTFSPAGTFAGVIDRLPHVRDLGVTALELMPVADFAGLRNWGYDGVCLYAPSRAYGSPEDLRRLVDAAHALGIAVLLDAVYNHLGPEGAYLPQFNPQYLTHGSPTPWGQAVTLDGPGSAMVRRFIIDNAVHWIREYHFDGLRLDATHSLIDNTPRHIVRDLAAAVHAVSNRPVVIHAEDYRNMAAMVDDVENGGWGLDGFWADDFHHAMRRFLAGDTQAYYMDYAGTTSEIARIIRHGWLFTGQYSTFLNEIRGTDPSGISLRRSVVCLQNHDQIGNRAMGERLHHQIAPEVWRAASTVLLMAPMTPLLFMGQEWSASTPFQFFTDLESGLGQLVTQGRRREFAGFPEFSAPDARMRIPDPQALSTFEASRLKWEEIDDPSHASVLALYRALIALRLDNPALGAADETMGDAVALDENTLLMRRHDEEVVYWIVAKLGNRGPVNLDAIPETDGLGHGGQWEVLMTTEEPLFATDPRPPIIDCSGDSPRIRFARPGAVVLKQSRR